MNHTNGVPLVRGLGGVSVVLAPPNLVSFRVAAWVAIVAASLAGWAGIALSGSLATACACGAILIFGLPHGALDIELLVGSPQSRHLARHWLVAAYLVCAGITYMIWCMQPLFALALFLTVAVAHFAEDWSACRAALLAHGMALATVTAPILFHRAEITALFISLTGSSSATVLVDLLMLVAPVALLVAAVGCADLVQNGQPQVATAGIITLSAMIALSPVIGFAIYFCLLHSPAHLQESASRLFRSACRTYTMGSIIAVICAVTSAAFGLTALLYLFQPHLTMTEPLFRATFVILSVLTVPHMLMPHLVDWYTVSRSAVASTASEARPLTI